VSFVISANERLAAACARQNAGSAGRSVDIPITGFAPN
jgi:hypothetical protein